MSAPGLVIRPARSGEAAILTELCIRAKAHWGYDFAFMAAAARLLQIGESEIQAGGVLTALRSENAATPSGVAVVVPLRRPRWCEISHLFVTPECFGIGIGRALFQAAIDHAAEQGARHVSILADPNAALFYSKLGARHCGEAPSGVERNRMLPLFEFAIASRSATALSPASHRHRRA